MISTRQSHSAGLEVSDRHRWLPASEIIDALELRPGMSVAELGAGHGDLILKVADAVGTAGHAFAVESSPEKLARLRDRAQGSRNLHVVEAPHHATPIASGCCDRVLLANCWAELPDPVAALREAARLLREDGRLILVEWHAGAECPEAPALPIPRHEMVQLLERNTWDIHRHGEMGPYCYFLDAAVSDESVQS